MAARSPRDLEKVRQILVIEDHPDTARLFDRLLRERGHQVRIACSIAEATQLCCQLRFDVVLCDIGLPDGSGTDLVPTLRQHCPEARLLAVTAHAMEHEVEQILAAGFEAVVRKPATIDSIMHYVN